MSLIFPQSRSKVEFRLLLVSSIAYIYIIAVMICLGTNYSIIMVNAKVLNLSKMEDIVFKACIRLFSV